MTPLLLYVGLHPRHKRLDESGTRDDDSPPPQNHHTAETRQEESEERLEQYNPPYYISNLPTHSNSNPSNSQVRHLSRTLFPQKPSQREGGMKYVLSHFPVTQVDNYPYGNPSPHLQITASHYRSSLHSVRRGGGMLLVQKESPWKE